LLSIQQANEVARQVAEKFSVPTPPPLYVTSKLPSQYAGAYYHDGGQQFIKIRPEYFTERTIAHEVGHYVYRTRLPANRQTDHESEELAQMIERWWVHKRQRERTLIDGKLAEQTVAFTLNHPINLAQGKQVAQALRESEIGESIDRIGFRGRYFYVVMKPVQGVDGAIPLLMPVILVALAVVGLGIVAWTTPLLAPGPIGLPNIVWILIAGTALFVALGWAVSRFKKL